MTHRIVIVGGGAGGLELATQLGDRLGRRELAHVTLVDRKRTHFWKPHLHEIAAGTMNLGRDELSYMAQAHWHAFTARVGEMVDLDRRRRSVRLAPHVDEWGEVVTPASEIPYDTLVMAVGSQSNDFGTPGVADHAISLDTPADAEHFHRRLMNALIRAHAQSTALAPHQLHVAIVGAGATGVELAAELCHASRQVLSYGLERLSLDCLGVHLIEAGPRVLPALAQRISDRAHRELLALGVHVHLNARVARVERDAVVLADGRTVPAELIVWAAGVKAPAFLSRLCGLEVNALNQLVVRPTLQTTFDNDVFAIGDCAAFRLRGCDEPRQVPPRAQAAHQQAAHLVDALGRRLRQQPLRDWRYRDFGSLVALGRGSTVGNLMGGLGRGSVWIEGRLAWLAYASLYHMHQRTLHGTGKMLRDLLARWLARGTQPRVKLH